MARSVWASYGMSSRALARQARPDTVWQVVAGSGTVWQARFGGASLGVVRPVMVRQARRVAVRLGTVRSGMAGTAWHVKVRLG